MDKHYKDYIQIGLNIMRYRKEQGLTQDQLSEMAGYSRNHLQRVETAAGKDKRFPHGLIIRMFPKMEQKKR